MQPIEIAESFKVRKTFIELSLITFAIMMLVGGQNALADPFFSSVAAIDGSSGAGIFISSSDDQRGSPYPPSSGVADAESDSIGNSISTSATSTTWRGGMSVTAAAQVQSGPFDPNYPVDFEHGNVYATVASAGAGAEISMDNLLLLGPATDTPVLVSPSVALSGTMSGVSGISSSMGGTISASYQFLSRESLARDSGSITISQSAVSGSSTDATGFLADALSTTTNTVHAGNFIPFITAFPGERLSLDIAINISAFANVGLPSDAASFNADFGHTFELNFPGPIFNLPPGYTVNSTDGFIVDNHFVPEPSLPVLVGSALIALLAITRRKSQHRCCRLK